MPSIIKIINSMIVAIILFISFSPLFSCATIESPSDDARGGKGHFSHGEKHDHSSKHDEDSYMSIREALLKGLPDDAAKLSNEELLEMWKSGKKIEGEGDTIKDKIKKPERSSSKSHSHESEEGESSTFSSKSDKTERDGDTS